ncbi:hypothetical protein GCM10028796_19330 [Ramlibacter monticola]|uniref:Uncharacterized protein n=1 Tax=Ramlibacter monticola TaxID=1926872 RepID=A0A937CTE7_9BURK|nr:hypothetical protein [Ramlibacter monticola]MBL0392191.1 hypothetical protein [Ramlibacter monticola]
MNMQLYEGGLAVVLALGAMTHPARAETFRCQLADRVVSYQQTPCAVPDFPAPPSRAEPAPRPAPSPAGPPAATRNADEPFALLTRRQREVLDLTARLERCRADVPGFAEKSNELARAWRARHAATLSGHSRFLGMKVRAFPRGDAASCSDDWLRELEPLARLPDPRYGSAEKTWELFVRGLQAADRAAVMACVTGPIARAMRERLERLGDADLRRMAANIRALKVQWGDDYTREGLVLHGDRVDAIAFTNVNEEWKIRELLPRGNLPVTPRRSSPDS